MIANNIDYNLFFDMIKNRRTPRFVETNDIPFQDVQKIYDAIQYAPSFDKVYPYNIYFLTNSAQGIEKKQQLIEYFRCSGDRPGDTFEGKEINRSFLSGLCIAYVSNNKKSSTAVYVPPNTTSQLEALIERLNLSRFYCKDIAISATYAMLTANILGYEAGMFGGCTNAKDAAKIFTNEPNSRLELVVTIATGVIPPTDPSKNRQYFSYKGQNTYVIRNKHLSKPNNVARTII